MFYALGDIHGQRAQLERALALIIEDGGADAPLFFVGDLVDRGANSRAVIQRIIDGQAAGKPWQCVLGNHDLMFLDFVRSGNVDHAEIKSGKTWLHQALGGCATLASYMKETELDHPDWKGWHDALKNGLDPTSASLLQALCVAAKKAVPTAHLDWIAALPVFLEAPARHRIVHAGIRPDVAMRDQNPSDLIWIRDGWLEYDGALDFIYVHGHTALDFPKHHRNRINIDGGAGYGRPLVPCGFDGTGWFTLDETGRTALLP